MKKKSCKKCFGEGFRFRWPMSPEPPMRLIPDICLDCGGSGQEGWKGPLIVRDYVRHNAFWWGAISEK
jgi:DnaJ-class molecular chaperone